MESYLHCDMEIADNTKRDNCVSRMVMPANMFVGKSIKIFFCDFVCEQYDFHSILRHIYLSEFTIPRVICHKILIELPSNIDKTPHRDLHYFLHCIWVV